MAAARRILCKTFDLTNDIDAVYATLQRFSANGGGDTPESVNEALNEALTKPSWSKELARLNRELGATLVAYGSERERRDVFTKQAASESAPAAVTADRLSFNVKAGRAVQGKGELLDALAGGKLKVSELKRDQLPKEWQGLKETELKAAIEKKQAERTALQAKILKLNQEREHFLAAERKKAVKSDSFDEQVAGTIRAQAAKKGISYGEK